ncbi:MAG: alpha/beta fold hydrolase [Jatrophihabitans sp.]|uniref:alpha/beta fold hydrolase n=1 Tax=Jatrophihabitans sp. TaxID=1932789 RepID=UPI003F81F36D
MIRRRIPDRLRTRTGAAVAVVVLLLVVAGVVAIARSGSPTIRTSSQMITGTPEGSTPVQLDTTLYLPETTPAPAVLLAHGFGGTKQSVASVARSLAGRGYVVLTWTARGFGRSGGLIHLDAPAYEVHDASLLVSWLQQRPQVDRNRIAVAGASYGGGLALLLAGTDPRIKAVAADITWNDLGHALFPNNAGTSPGVFKKLWAGYLFSGGFGNLGSGSLGSLGGLGGAGGQGGPGPDAAPAGGATTGSLECGRFAPAICAGYQQAAQTGTPDASLLALLHASSPATVLDRIKAPTLVSQGEQDSLFPLSEADANARGIAANGTPVKVVWRAGGHDDPSTDMNVGQVATWFDDVFAGRVQGTQPFQLTTQRGAVQTSTGRRREQLLQAPGYPGIDGTAQPSIRVTLAGGPQTIAAPAGGNPAAINAVPGLGGILDQAQGLGIGVAQLSGVPGQTAVFVSPAVPRAVTIAGSTTVQLRVTAHKAGDAVLFAGLRDVGPGGVVLPSNLVAPIRVPSMRAGETRTVTVHLPTVVRPVPAGDRLALSVGTTDLAFQSPGDPRTYTVALAGGSAAAVSVPTTDAKVIRTGHPLVWLLVGALVALVCLLVVAFELRRRRRIVKPDASLREVPVAINGLVKEYAGGYRAVDGISFQVQRGQVVGLLGPNGAGKTTALRVLVGLITPTEGTVHVFGEPVLPGAPVLARLGAFIEGPGFLPHLSGRDNLRLYWAATGRPDEDADFETALAIAGLGSSVDRKVKTYSHGMKQRLGIAQAMLGLPELLVLDEPTNGLDPPQIAEMREVMQSYAQTGRTVVVSSHLLAEVEQTCTHVVVMHKGQVVAAGPTAEIAGAGGLQLDVADPHAAAAVLAEAGIEVELVPARRALEDVFLGLIGGEE